MFNAKVERGAIGGDEGAGDVLPVDTVYGLQVIENFGQSFGGDLEHFRPIGRKRGDNIVIDIGAFSSVRTSNAERHKHSSAYGDDEKNNKLAAHGECTPFRVAVERESDIVLRLVAAGEADPLETMAHRGLLPAFGWHTAVRVSRTDGAITLGQMQA